jgi:CRAL/TRIO domain
MAPPFLARAARTLFRGTPFWTEKICADCNDSSVLHQREDPDDHKSRTARMASLFLSLSCDSSTWSAAFLESAAADPLAGLAQPDDGGGLFGSVELRGGQMRHSVRRRSAASKKFEQHNPSRPSLLLGSSGRSLFDSAGRTPRPRIRLLSLRRPSPPVAASSSTRGTGGDDNPALQDEEDKINEMMGLLTEDQVETAARTSYRYYCCTASSPAAASAAQRNGDEGKDEITSPESGEEPNTLRSKCARDMARRYLRSERHHDPHAAVRTLAATLQFRQQMDVDGLRMAFHDPASPHRRGLLQRLSDRAAYVCGYDVVGRSTFVFEPHRVSGHDEHWTVRQHVYTLERAVACSRACDGTVNAVVNFRGFSYARHAPPASIGQQFFTTLGSHYVGRVHQIFIVDAPGEFYLLWALLKPFIGRNTRSKIQFVNSEAQKEAVIGRYYEHHQARPWMLPGGEKGRELDLDEYLLRTPFDKSFDEK